MVACIPVVSPVNFNLDLLQQVEQLVGAICSNLEHPRPIFKLNPLNIHWLKGNNKNKQLPDVIHLLPLLCLSKCPSDL